MIKQSVLGTAKDYSGFNPIDDRDFERTMQKEVEPFLNALRKTHRIRAKGGREIYCETFVPEILPAGADGKKECRGLIVIFHGFCEFCSKFDEFVYYVLKQGYALCRFDQFGHGFSGRETKNSSKVHIRSFQTYVDCAHAVVEQIACPLAADLSKTAHKKVPLFLFAHSMGGAVAALFLQQYPDVFKAAVLASPMLELNIPGMSNTTARLMLTFIRLFAGGERFFRKDGDFTGNYVFADYKKTICSERRFFYHFNKRKTEVRYQTWNGTYAWLDESLKAIRRIFKKGNLQKITAPILLFQAEKDDTVPLGGQNRFVELVPSARMIVCTGANHELYNGTNETVARWYPELFDFFDGLVR
ncbi:alpha/beta fold hydrolase [Treponema sp. HNW]|uniref:alpha/beta fold hydrolase n=1 Tax=Treponema sp. HNW TaxID=3116654 RepID=UPI003D1142D3